MQLCTETDLFSQLVSHWRRVQEAQPEEQTRRSSIRGRFRCDDEECKATQITNLELALCQEEVHRARHVRRVRAVVVGLQNQPGKTGTL
jgi:hypothetical protein